MKRAIILLVVLACCGVCSTALAMYDVLDRGAWPKDWPVELEPFRTQSRTLIGPMIPQQHFEIPFTKQTEFESAWPHIIKLKSKGAPIILLRSPNRRLGEVVPAGVRVHTPPAGTNKQLQPEKPLAGPALPGRGNVRERWMWTTYIELIVDGDIVDLNRIPLPADSPIIDERFDKE